MTNRDRLRIEPRDVDGRHSTTDSLNPPFYWAIHFRICSRDFPFY